MTPPLVGRGRVPRPTAGLGKIMPEEILMIEDDESLATMVAEYLASMDMRVTPAPDAAQGLALLERNAYDALVLDIMLPDLDGFEVCRQVRTRSDIPILMLTARGDEMDRIVGLEIGADDYLPKPFNPRELLARLRAILRRRAPLTMHQTPVLRFGRLEIDLDGRTARLDGRDCALTGYQFDLLCALAQNAGRVMSRDALVEYLRDQPFEVFDRSIDVHISRIRAAIEDDPKHPRRVLTLRGTGYVFAKNQDEDA